MGRTLSAVEGMAMPFARSSSVYIASGTLQYGFAQCNLCDARAASRLYRARERGILRNMEAEGIRFADGPLIFS